MAGEAENRAGSGTGDEATAPATLDDFRRALRRERRLRAPERATARRARGERRGRRAGGVRRRVPPAGRVPRRVDECARGSTASCSGRCGTTGARPCAPASTACWRRRCPTTRARACRPRAATRPDRATEARDAYRTVLAALDRLDDDKREVFVLAELEEMPIVEIATLYGSSRTPPTPACGSRVPLRGRPGRSHRRAAAPPPRPIRRAPMSDDRDLERDAGLLARAAKASPASRTRRATA